MKLQGEVYFIGDGEAIKIGFSSRPKRRLEGLQSGHKLPLTILATVPATVMDELSIHKHFEHLRVRGEWFRADSVLMHFIKELPESLSQVTRVDLPLSAPPKIAPQPPKPRTLKDEMLQVCLEVLAFRERQTDNAVRMYSGSVAGFLEWVATHTREEIARSNNDKCLLMAMEALETSLRIAHQ